MCDITSGFLHRFLCYRYSISLATLLGSLHTQNRQRDIRQSTANTALRQLNTHVPLAYRMADFPASGYKTLPAVLGKVANNCFLRARKATDRATMYLLITLRAVGRVTAPPLVPQVYLLELKDGKRVRAERILYQSFWHHFFLPLAHAIGTKKAIAIFWVPYPSGEGFLMSFRNITDHR